MPALLSTRVPAVAPPILSGHGVDATNQIVLGAATLDRLHKHVGQTVTVSYGKPETRPRTSHPFTMHIVGSATFPAVGFASFVADHTSMGTGALVSTLIQPARFRKAQLSKDPNLNGPDMVFVRVKPGVSAARARRDLQRIVQATDKALSADPQATGNSVSVVGVQRPAQIVNYRSIGSAPVLLPTGLAVGAVFGLSLTLIASVRRRRRELALLKTLGFTRRQLAAVVAWQSTISVLIGVVLGVPIGIISGRARCGTCSRARSTRCRSRPSPSRRSRSSPWARWCSPTSWLRCPGSKRPAPGPRRCCAWSERTQCIRGCTSCRALGSGSLPTQPGHHLRQ